ncbi:hypothetical protein GWI33_020731 [Rhynchophorus ferrugineus]|uniref:Uncharacterized protein n=1 Tax=Rhynchophorus ferrugineus TaxID=354439 RepID=A0A834HRU7_RHYFE|nr:hypothetical protein GWI33_020731 [Rhynchophorus ferrugineus]
MNTSNDRIIFWNNCKHLDPPDTSCDPISELLKKIKSDNADLPILKPNRLPLFRYHEGYLNMGFEDIDGLQLIFVDFISSPILNEFERLEP